MEIKLIGRDFSVCKVEDYSQVDLTAEYCFIGRTGEENSLVCLTDKVPGNVLEREDGWRGFYIDGVLDFSLVGILAKLSGLLAEHKISIFAVSTFNTDYILVRQDKEQEAVRVLSAAGYQVTAR
ncbi:ACT domain-containing protein [Anaerovibrio sp.]|uniref:ACT domain-containing protein n=1 Tax=Anaerovibrio sp. TaxID=1872532 RepID=UPI003F17FC36